MSTTAPKWLKYIEILHLYKIYIDPLVRCVSIMKCTPECLSNMIYVEQYLYQCGHLPNVYPNMWGCISHGNFKVISLNHPSTSFYITQWSLFLARQHVVRGECTPECRMVHIPQMFHINNEIQYHFEPIMFCAKHSGVHFCVGSSSRCNACECCATKRPCPFQCMSHSARETCYITGVNLSSAGDCPTVDDIDRHHASANQHTDFREGLDMRGTIRRVNVSINNNIQTWITNAHNNHESLSQSVETLFSKWMDRFCYVCTNEDGERVYLYPNITTMRHIQLQTAVNYMEFSGYEKLNEMIFFVWNLLRYHITEIFGWQYVIALVAHLNAEHGLHMRNITIPLNPDYNFLILRLHHTEAPKKPIRCNISVACQHLCSWISQLDIHQQKNVYQVLREKEIPLFLYRDEVS